MAKLKVLLLHCGNYVDNVDKHNKNLFYMPIGFFALASMCVAAGAECEIKHSDIDSVDKIDATQYSIIGMDLHWVSQAYSVLLNSIRFKEQNKNLFLFLGGYTASFFADEIMESYPCVDAVVCGYGEKPVLQLCRLFSETGTTKDLRNIENLVWRKDGRVKHNGITYVYEEYMMNIADYTFFKAMKSFKAYLYLSRFWTRFPSFAKGSVYFLPVGRGCLANCLHCGGSNYANKNINNFSGSVFYPLEMVISNIQKALVAGFDIMYMEFENDVSDEWYIHLFHELKQREINVKVIFGAWKLPNKNLIDSISEYGEAIIVLSPETAVEGLRRILKGEKIAYSNNELEQCISYMNDKGNISCQLYFGYFLPGETYDSVKRTLKYIYCLFERYRRIEIEYSVYTADPGSLLNVNPEKYGMKSSVLSLKDYINTFRSIYLKDSNEEKPQDIRLFYPKSFSECEIVLLEKVIYNFQRVLYRYRRTCCLIENRYSWNTLFNKLVELSEEHGYVADSGMDEFVALISVEFFDETVRGGYQFDINDTHIKPWKVGAPWLYRD